MEISNYYDKLNLVIQLQNELLEMKKELEGRGLALPLQIRNNKTADMKKYLKEYYDKNKDKYRREKETYRCDVCDCEILVSSKKFHEQSNKHVNNMATAKAVMTP